VVDSVARNDSEAFMQKEFQPYIPSSTILPEITIKATILSIILALVMAGSNAYLGLKIGMTVSATIPAAVISMAILRFFRQSNILENNIVQTAASAGEAIAAAVVFTLPALLVMGYWNNFPFWYTFFIVAIGGTLGVLFSIPLRRAFVVESDLKFPEGIATGEVLKAGDRSAKGNVKDLMWGGLLAALFKVGQSALMILEESIGYWVQKGKVVYGASSGFSLVLVGAGYIVGIGVGLAMILGAIIAWAIGVPLYGYLEGLPQGANPAVIAKTIWSGHIRIMGVGTMVVGGVWTLFKLIDPIRRAIKSSFETFAKARLGKAFTIHRTEYDIPMKYVLLSIILLTMPLVYIFHDILSCCQLELNLAWHWTIVIIISIFAVLFGFLASAIAGYMAGLVGSSNNPVSAVNLMAVLSISVVLLALLGHQIDFVNDTVKTLSAATISIVVTAVMCNAAAISGDNLQDLKSGQIVGATPWKQQIMLVLGVIVGALAIAPIMEILYQAYGIAGVFPREGMDPGQVLNAPTASVLSAVTKAIFTGALDWTMFCIGGAISVVLILIEVISRATKKPLRIPILGVGMGIYLPMDIIFPIFLGGLIAYLADKKLDKQRSNLGVNYEEAADGARKRGLLFCSGMIAGEAIMGIVLAIPFAAYQSIDIFKIRPENFDTIALTLAAVFFAVINYYIYHIGSTAKKPA
jgi:putative OPT family oligopeptide transporter